MKRYIALLRGINVGGHKKVPMAELRVLLAKSGLLEVKTYIQSGNVIFKSNIESEEELEKKIRESINDFFGFEVSVLVKTRKTLDDIFNNCPFTEDKKVDSYFAMLTEVPNKELVKQAEKKTYENEEYHIINNCIYFYCSNGYGNAKFKLNFFEKTLNVDATARNYRTMVKLLAMSNDH